ncbi:NACHT, LRR and PYD domains-containing protein 1 [Chelonia mydas]|uniref:NACHT, LRR and PYD domains-containing protein 1 n=1 Tax=Chelonia mydas TaxID=8469 RepID=M7CME0_CHEMY|nr:NACHT, LRR and PYD domains-containing protein 1 [Chelonia mydas]
MASSFVSMTSSPVWESWQPYPPATHRLGDCDFTAACCRELASALSTDRTLRELNLQEKNMGHFGLKLLCEGLKHPTCKLQKLCLSQHSVNEETRPELHAVKVIKPDLVTEIRRFRSPGFYTLPCWQGIVQHPFQPTWVREIEEEGKGPTISEHLPSSSIPSRASEWHPTWVREIEEEGKGPTISEHLPSSSIPSRASEWHELTEDLPMESEPSSTLSSSMAAVRNLSKLKLPLELESHLLRAVLYSVFTMGTGKDTAHFQAEGELLKVQQQLGKEVSTIKNKVLLKFVSTLPGYYNSVILP